MPANFSLVVARSMAPWRGQCTPCRRISCVLPVPSSSSSVTDAATSRTRPPDGGSPLMFTSLYSHLPSLSSIRRMTLPSAPVTLRPQSEWPPPPPAQLTPGAMALRLYPAASRPPTPPRRTQAPCTAPVAFSHVGPPCPWSHRFVPSRSAGYAPRLQRRLRSRNRPRSSQP